MALSTLSPPKPANIFWVLVLFKSKGEGQTNNLFYLCQLVSVGIDSFFFLNPRDHLSWALVGLPWLLASGYTR